MSDWRAIHPTLERIIADMAQKIRELEARIADLEARPSPRPVGRPRKQQTSNASL